MNLDRRLLQQAYRHRALLLFVVGLSLAAGLLVVWQANLLTRAIQAVYLDASSLGKIKPVLAALLGVISLRAFVSWSAEITGSTLSRKVKNSLRERLYLRIIHAGPTFTTGQRTGELASVLVEGVESVDAYFNQYLPGLVAAILVPATILCFVFPTDLLTGVVFLLTAPLIPIFMLLIGNKAQSMTRKQWQTLSQLKAYFLDVLQGLTTLKSLGCSQNQMGVIERQSEKYRRITMGVLQVAFTSALALELVATLSTAIIAVQVGLRLLYGGLTFAQAFFILLLAPEFYQPLRLLGSRFHSGMAGVAAAQRIFALLERPLAGSVELNSSSPDSQDISIIPTHSAGLNGQIGEIRFENIFFEYEEGHAALHGVSFALQCGQKVALVGPSGAGKSTVAGLLLHFIQPNQGEILVNGFPLERISQTTWRSQLAWVPQRPYIFPGTVLENLLLSRPDASFEEIRQATRSAHIHEFICSLPGGYETLLAEGGAPLSAGQVQRLALARAFLRDAPLLILDEPTASLDPEHEALLQESLEVLSQGRTALIIAHRLNTIINADNILVLEAGTVVQAGKHANLLGQSGMYRVLVSAAIEQTDREYAGQTDTPWIRRTTSVFLPLVSDLPFPEIRSHLARKKPFPSSKRLILWLLGWIAPFSASISLAALVGFVTIASSMALMGASAYIISSAALHPSIAELQVAIVSVRLFGLSRGVFRYLERLLTHQVTLNLLSSLRVRLFSALEPLAPARLLQFRSGDLLARFVGDIESLEGFYVRGLSPPFIAILVGLGGFALLGKFSLQLGVILLVGLSISGFGIPLVSFLAGRRASAEEVWSRSQLNATLVNVIQGLPELMLFGQVESRSEEVFRWIRGLKRSQERLALISAFQSSIIGALANYCLWFLLVAAIPLVIGGHLPGVYLAALLLAAFASFEAVAPLPQAAQQLKGDLDAAGRLHELVDAEPEVVDPSPPFLSPQLPDLHITNLSFKYPAGPVSSARHYESENAENPWVLTDINIDIPFGKRLAIVGPSGSGKSTLVSLLLRFWEFDNGQVLLSGHDLRTYNQQSIRSQFSALSQNPFIFSATLLDNIRIVNPQATQEQIDQVVQGAFLQEFLTGLPQGYQTWVGEQGVRLSAGERQRVAIARVLLKKAPILILDEPTAHLDALTENRVMSSLLENSLRRSMLLVTHRLVGMQAMDEILVLVDGRVVERGRHSELIQLDGRYRRMWELQRQQLIADFAL